MFEIKKPEFVNKTFRMEKTLVERLSKYASKNDISLNALIVQCCEYAIDNMKVEKNEKK